MAKVRFLQKGEPSQKKDYKPLSLKINRNKKIWQFISVVQGLVIIYLLYFKY
jgi:hypothetical protein